MIEINGEYLYEFGLNMWKWLGSIAYEFLDKSMQTLGQIMNTTMKNSVIIKYAYNAISSVPVVREILNTPILLIGGATILLLALYKALFSDVIPFI